MDSIRQLLVQLFHSVNGLALLDDAGIRIEASTIDEHGCRQTITWEVMGNRDMSSMPDPMIFSPLTNGALWTVSTMILHKDEREIVSVHNVRKSS